MPTTIARAPLFDSLCDAVDTVRALNRARPSRLARIEAAWDWLLQQEAYQFEGETLLIASQSEPGIVRRASWQGCTCPSRLGCYHVEAASLIGRAVRYNSIQRRELPFTPERPAFACERNAPARYSRADDPRVSAEDLVSDLYS